MKRTILTLFAAAALAGGVTPSYAQENEEKPKEKRSVSRSVGREVTDTIKNEDTFRKQTAGVSEKDRARGKAETPALVSSAGIACTVSDAAFRGQTTLPDKTKADTFEVACSEGLGYLLTRKATTTQHFDCVAAATTAKPGPDGKPSGSVSCILPANADANTGLQSLVQKAGLACTIKDVTWLGYSEAGKLNRYEVACQEGAGFVLDRLDNGQVASRTCLESASACTLTPRAQQFAALNPAVAKAGRTCTISDLRVVGTSASTRSTFYELACSGATGFMLETRADGSARAVDCLQATGIGGGCKLNDLSSALAARTQTYVATLKTLGIDCADAQSRVIGVQKGAVEREAAELKCSNRPLGVILLAPTTPGQGQAEANDCIGAGRYSVSCTLTPKEPLLAALTAAIRQAPRACDVNDFRYMATSAEGDVVEVSCGGAGQNAYVLDMPPSRGRPLRTIACSSWVERGGERCSLPGNAGK